MDDDRDFDDEFDDGGADDDIVGAGDLVDDAEDLNREAGPDSNMPGGESVAFIPSSSQQGLFVQKTS